MSEIFFKEMDIPQAQTNLKVGSGSQAKQTGQMLAKLEEVILQEKPDLVLVVGDTNSTLSGALAAAKLHIPIGHVEAGLRSFNRKMPEEINRVLTDHLSTLLFCPSQIAQKNLHAEGIEKGVSISGDVMIDALYHFLPEAKKRNCLETFSLKAKEYFLLTVHRPANTDSPENLKAILKACLAGPYPVFFPVHPRTRLGAKKILGELKKEGIGPANVKMVDPVGYLDMLCLEENARAILTDSGGIQKEALYLKTPCVTLREETEWLETLETPWNCLVGANEHSIRTAMERPMPRGEPPQPYGTGIAAEKIANDIQKFLNR
jgi:UDP-N-acetylglucosamine 2-epimerase